MYGKIELPWHWSQDAEKDDNGHYKEDYVRRLVEQHNEAVRLVRTFMKMAGKYETYDH